MNANDGFKKATQPKRISVREAVTQHGDSWRFYASNEYARSSELVTPDGMDRMEMILMEKGITSRIRQEDIHGW